MEKGFDLEYVLQIYKDHSVPNGRWGYQLNTKQYGVELGFVNNDFDDIPDRLCRYLIKSGAIKSKESLNNDDSLFGAKIKIAINKKFESTIEGFMAYYGFKESDKKSETSSIYEWNCIGVDLESVMQLLVEQLAAIIEGKRYFIVTFSGLAQAALNNLPDPDKINTDYVNTISDGIGVACLTVFVYKEDEDEN